MKLLLGSALAVALLSSLLLADPPAALPDDPACTEVDRGFIKRTYELAQEAMDAGSAPFGAVLVSDGKIVAEYRNDVSTSHDPTHHAELALISTFSPKLDHETFRNGTLYASSEPCIMCCGAILNAGILRVVYGTTEAQFQRIIRDQPKPDPLTSREIIARANPAVQVCGPLMEKEGLALHQAYWPGQMKKWQSP